MISIIDKWNRSNSHVKKAFPHTIWSNNQLILYGETYEDMFKKLIAYLDKAYGEEKWYFDDFKIYSRNQKVLFSQLDYRKRNVSGIF